jgi:hypothetical protein
MKLLALPYAFATGSDRTHQQIQENDNQSIKYDNQPKPPSAKTKESLDATAKYGCHIECCVMESWQKRTL